MFKKFVVFTLLVALLVSALPVGTVFAAPSADDPNPNTGKDAAPRLEKVFARMQEWYAKQDEVLQKAPTLISKAQALVDKASANGLDMTAVQSALDAFAATLPAAQAAHDTAGQILTAHAGFDDKGKVSDLATATQTVKDAGAALKESRQAHLTAGQALRDALKAFRETHKPPRTNNGNGNPLPASAQP